jgi:hypothetical protein
MMPRSIAAQRPSTTAMEKASLIRSSRRQGPDVWEYRWREFCSGQTRKHRRIVIGTLNTLKDESAALKAIAALRKDIKSESNKVNKYARFILLAHSEARINFMKILFKLANGPSGASAVVRVCLQRPQNVRLRVDTRHQNQDTGDTTP